MRWFAQLGPMLLVFCGIAVAQQTQPPVAPLPPPSQPPAIPPAQPPAQPPVQQPAPIPPDPKIVAASVNGANIPERAVFRAINQVPADKRDKAREQIINFLVDNMLVDQYLEQLKITVEPAEIDTAIKELKDDIDKEKKDFSKVMQDLMLTEAELRDQLNAEVRWRKFLEKYAPEDKLKEFFTANKNFFDGSQVRARHLLVSAKRDDAKELEAARLKAAAIKKQVEEKATQDFLKLPPIQDNLEKQKVWNKTVEATFAEFARKESSCDSKTDGGEVGWFARAGRMVEPFARIAFALKPYQISEPVATEFGCHLILPIDTKPGREVEYKDLKDSVKEVYAERMREAIITRGRPTARIVVAPPTKQ